MDFGHYQDQTEKTAVYPPDRGLSYTALGLNGEAGEVAEKVKKYLREDDPEYLAELEDELGDVLWYLARVCDELGLDLQDVAGRNVDKLLDRQERDVLTGSGDDR